MTWRIEWVSWKYDVGVWVVEFKVRRRVVRRLSNVSVQDA